MIVESLKTGQSAEEATDNIFSFVSDTLARLAEDIDLGIPSSIFLSCTQGNVFFRSRSLPESLQARGLSLLITPARGGWNIRAVKHEDIFGDIAESLRSGRLDHTLAVQLYKAAFAAVRALRSSISFTVSVGNDSFLWAELDGEGGLIDQAHALWKKILPGTQEALTQRGMGIENINLVEDLAVA